MSRKHPQVDTARLALMLTELRLPTMKAVWPEFTERADQEGWPAAHTLAALIEQELVDRARRRIERHLNEAQLPPGKTLSNFDFDAVPMISKAQVMALSAGDRWLDEGANLILFGPPGGGKSHLAAAIGLALVENGFRVLYTRTTDLVQRLQVARRELTLETAVQKLNKYHLLILDDTLGLSRASRESMVGKLLMRTDPFPGLALTHRNLRRRGIRIVGRLTGASGATASFSRGEPAAVSSIVWATGYRDRTAKDARGSFIERRGVTPVPNLFHIGRNWQWTRSSGLIVGVARDVEYLIPMIRQALRA